MTGFLSHNWPWLAGVIDLTLAITVTVHLVLWKRDSRAVIAWAGLAWLAPILGSIAYFCFGVNRIQRKASGLGHAAIEQQARKLKLSKSIDSTSAPASLADQYPNLAGLAVLGANLSGRPLLPGNRVEALINGDEAYPQMLDAIRSAKYSVAFLSYIFDNDRAGEAFLSALSEASNRGVQVRVLVDDVGSKYSRPNMVARMQRVGLSAASFLPTRISSWLKYANLRNHRKILVVDGRIGFTGGTNIRVGHWLSLQPASPVQCLHFRLEGPVVADLQETFISDWAFTTGEWLSGESWFPELQPMGPALARGIEHGPDEDFEKMSDLILGALSVARRRVRIITPYFLPDSSLIKALGVTAMRGVDVEILIPSQSNVRVIQWATTAQLWQMLEKGCRILYSAPPFDHTKLMIVDDVWSLIGSTNWDPRSLRLNFEFNVECYDEALARTLNEIVDAKVKLARPVTMEDVNGRPMYQRLRDGLARLLSPYL